MKRPHENKTQKKAKPSKEKIENRKESHATTIVERWTDETALSCQSKSHSKMATQIC
jgi:hypothetical protein